MKQTREIRRLLQTSLDGTTLVSGGDQSDLLFWDLGSLPRGVEYPEPLKCAGPTYVAGLAFTSRGHLAVAAGATVQRNGQLTVLNTKGTPTELIAPKPYPETIRAVAYSPDESQMAITYKFSAGIVHVLDAMTLENVFEFRGHSDKVTTLTFTPDGTRLITGSDDGTVRFWDLHHGRPVGTLRVGGRVRNVKMLPDGDGLLTLSRDGWLRLWRATPQIANVEERG